MLDVGTLLIVICITAFLLGVGWFVIWSTQRKLRGLRTFGTTWMLLGVGVAMLTLRDVISPLFTIILANYLINLGHVLMADGIARFLNQPRRLWLGGTILLITAVFWPLALYYAPENVAIRIAMAGLLLSILFAFMAHCFWQDRTLPRPLRWGMVILLCSHGIFLAIRGPVALILNHSAEMMASKDLLQGLFFLETLITMIFLFVGLVAMVAARLTGDIQDRNRALTLEVQQRRSLQEDLSGAFANERMLRQEQQYFMHMVSHEFRTPLAVIDRAAEMIGVLVPNRSGDLAPRITSIRDAVRRLVILIDTFLSMGRLDHGAMRLESMESSEVLADIRQHFAEAETGGRILLDTPEPQTLRIDGDRTMLRTIIVNLVDNALKYSPPDEPVRLTMSETAEQVHILVQDSGIGIPRREIASIGSRFFRASNTGAVPGTGLGLYTARRLTELHDGVLSVDSEIGKGTRIRISLPKRQSLPVGNQDGGLKERHHDSMHT